MNISINTTRYQLTPDSQGLIERKFGLLMQHVRDSETTRLEIEVEGMPEGQVDGAHYQVSANFICKGKLFHASTRSGSLESAVEKVRHELEAELKRARGKERSFLKRGGSAVKDFLRGWR